MPTKTRINGQNYTQIPRLVAGDIVLAGLPQTEGAPEGYGDLAAAVLSGGGGGTLNHDDLDNREDPDQHPISAITALQTTLDGKQKLITQSSTEPESPSVGDLWIEIT